MDKGRFLRLVAVLCLATFGAYYVVDHTAFRGDSPARRITGIHQRIIENSEAGFDAVIYGGSNSVYGLSAERMSELTGKSWLNLSGIRHYVNAGNFRQWVTETSSQPSLHTVKTVLFSYIDIYFPDISSEWVARDINYDPYIRMLPTRSLASELFPKFNRTLRQWDRRGAGIDLTRRVITPFGDLDFDLVECPSPTNAILLATPDAVRAARIAAPEVEFLLATFPQAQVIQTIPGVYHAPSFDSMTMTAFRSEYRAELLGILARSLPHAELARFTLVAEESVSSDELLCDTPWHPTELGRAIRTDKLVEALPDLG